MNESFQGIGILALAVFSYVAAEITGGNGFIAGMVFGNVIRHPCTFLFDFMKTEVQLLMLIAFLVFGAVLLPQGLEHLNSTMLLYALLNLTVIRMVPIAISLAGAGLSAPTKLFLGWFGPRGLASILFVLLIVEESDAPHREEILALVLITVALSALLHGVSAAPLAARFGRLIAGMGACEENQPACEIPLRDGSVNIKTIAARRNSK